MTFYTDTSFVYLFYFFYISYLRQAKFFGYLRTNLRCITVDSLTSTYDNIIIAYFTNSSSQRIRSSQCISTGKSTVGKQIAIISASI